MKLKNFSSQHKSMPWLAICASPEFSLTLRTCWRPETTLVVKILPVPVRAIFYYGKKKKIVFQESNIYEKSSSTQKEWKCSPTVNLISSSRKWHNILSLVFLALCYMRTFVHAQVFHWRIAQKKSTVMCNAKEFNRKLFLYPSRSVHHPQSIAQIKHT